MKFSLSVFLDTIFTAFISFILFFILFNYYFSVSVSVSLSITLTLSISIIAYFYLRNKKRNFSLSKADEQAMKIMSNQLKLYSLNEQFKVFTSLLDKLEIEYQKKKNFLYLPKKEVCIFPYYSFDSITKTDIVKVFNSIKSNDLAYIFASEFSSEIISFSARFDGRIILIDQKSLYKALSEQNILPKQKLYFPEKTKLKMSAFKNLFYKSNAKKHLWVGLSFLFLSLLAPIKVFYIVVGCAFLILSLITRLFGIEKTIA